MSEFVPTADGRKERFEPGPQLDVRDYRAMVNAAIMTFARFGITLPSTCRVHKVERRFERMQLHLIDEIDKLAESSAERQCWAEAMRTAQELAYIAESLHRIAPDQLN